jgi:hypothetical protein
VGNVRISLDEHWLYDLTRMKIPLSAVADSGKDNNSYFYK